MWPDLNSRPNWYAVARCTFRVNVWTKGKTLAHQRLLNYIHTRVVKKSRVLALNFFGCVVLSFGINNGPCTLRAKCMAIEAKSHNRKRKCTIRNPRKQTNGCVYKSLSRLFLLKFDPLSTISMVLFISPCLQLGNISIHRTKKCTMAGKDKKLFPRNCPEAQIFSQWRLYHEKHPSLSGSGMHAGEQQFKKPETGPIIFLYLLRVSHAKSRSLPLPPLRNGSKSSKLAFGTK